MQKTSSFFIFHFFYHCFFHFSVLCSDALDFAKCSSLFPNFWVENAAKHKKSTKKTKKMMSANPPFLESACDSGFDVLGNLTRGRYLHDSAN